MFNSVLLQVVVSGANTATQVLDTAKNVAAQVAQTALPVDQPKQASLSMLDLIVKGGYIMIPIGILSLLTVFYFFERFITINKASKLDKNFMNNIKDYIHNGNMDAAKALCKNSTSPAARMVEKGITRIGKPIKDFQS